MRIGKKKFQIPSPPFRRATVHTGSQTNSFTVEVNDLEWAAEHVKEQPTSADSNLLSLVRGLFIQQAIDEKLERCRQIDAASK